MTPFHILKTEEKKKERRIERERTSQITEFAGYKHNLIVSNPHCQGQEF